MQEKLKLGAMEEGVCVCVCVEGGGWVLRQKKKTKKEREGGDRLRDRGRPTYGQAEREWTKRKGKRVLGV